MIELLKNRSIISIRGKEAVKFLQNLTTNDLVNNIYSYNYLLSPQGRYLYDFFVYKSSDDELLVDVHSNCANSLLQKLGMYNLRNAVEINDVTNKYRILYSRQEPEIDSYKFVFTYHDPRFHKLGFRTMVEHNESFQEKAKGYMTDELLYFEDKYNFAIPDGMVDLVFDRSLVVQFGAAELGAISYKKGCYIGQEVISRARYQGTIRKKLFKLVNNHQELIIAEKGSEITDFRGNKVGVFCSGYKHKGIALLDTEVVTNTDELLMTSSKQQVKLGIPEFY